MPVILQYQTFEEQRIAVFLVEPIQLASAFVEQINYSRINGQIVLIMLATV